MAPRRGMKKERRSGQRNGMVRKPLSRLGIRQVLQEVRSRPQRLAELVSLLDHVERPLRARAALALARLAEIQPESALRHLERIRVGLRDDSAYVRWTLACAIGLLGARHPGRVARCLPELCSLVDDENPIAQSMACAALARIGSANPDLVRKHYETAKKEIPPAVARSLSTARRTRPKTSRSR